MTLHGTSPPMIRASATGLVLAPFVPSAPPPSPRASATMAVGEYCAPGFPKFPVSTQSSFSR